MDQELVRDMAARVAIPTLAAVFGLLVAGLSTIVKNWVQRRDLEYKRDMAIARAITSLTFVEQWLKAQEKMNDQERLAHARRMAQQQIDRSYALVEHIYMDIIRDTEDRRFALPFDAVPDIDWGDWLRSLLVLWRPRTIWAWVVHVIFYLYLPVFAFMTVVSLAIIQLDAYDITITMIIIFVLLLPLILLRWIAKVIHDSSKA